MNANLANFTDVLGDEIGNSQPLSLSSSSDGGVSNVLKCANKPNVPIMTVRPPKGTGQCGQNRSTEEIDPKYRHVFSYPYFNPVQSNVIEDCFYSDKSLVICAPTGSGKTVIFEMAIVQLLMELEDTQCDEDFKIIYMAPVKALCTERLTEWYPKFTKLGLMCIEVTGDTEVDFGQLKPYKIIITTPEKWDILTRRWRDHRALVEVIKLFLIDEVHILNDEVRGPVLEAVVSRMKTIESSAQSAHRIEKLQNEILGQKITHKHLPRIRFIAVSATVSNPEDVSSWLGTTDKPAVYYKYGDECRPVKLKRIVEGYPYPEGASMFKFDIILNYKLWPVIQKYHAGKPTLIFCNTRKSVILTAEALSRELTIGFNDEQKAKLTALASTIKNKKLQALVLSGVGCHHAGLLYEERMNIEHAFRNKDLPILITTTTLAMGVNLPAHLVIIKNTQQYVNGTYQEYSISTVLQMVGRAGRPQFDTEATAVIMTRLADKARYQALLGGCEPLQSYLHKRLAENLNSEAALGTVGDVAQCVQWLRSTFLYVRALQDPRKYLGLPQNSPQPHITKKIEELCVRAMNGLASAGLITMDEASCIESTEAGRLMSLYYLDLETMKHIMKQKVTGPHPTFKKTEIANQLHEIKIEGTESLDKLLQIVCECHELADMHLRVDERRTLNALNRNNNGPTPTIRFPMKGKITTRQMKLNCIIQAVLGCLPIVDPSLNQEATKVMRIAARVCRCLVAYITRTDLITPQPQFYAAILNSIVLAKCVVANLWENSPYMCKQLKGIGPAFSTLLASAGKTNFTLLEESHPRDLERLMNKGPPAGNLLRKQISFLPKYQLTMIPRNERIVLVQLVLLNQAHLLENMDNLTAGRSHKSYIIVGDSANHLLLLASFKDQDLITVFEGIITYEIRRKHDFEHKVFAHCISSEFVGIDDQTEYSFNSLEPYDKKLTSQSKFFTNKVIEKQTCITDTFKERKRKLSAETVKPSKEKKMKKNSYMEQFIPLKETFDDASISVTKDISNKQDVNAICIPNDKNEGSDDSMNDEKIDNILTEIEREMAKDSLKSTKTSNNFHNNNKKMSTCNADTQKNYKTQQTLNYSTTYNSYKAPNMPMKSRKFNGKSNYTFLDLLEKNTDLSENDNEVSSPQPHTGFSVAIKEEIQKYLLTTQNVRKHVDKPLEMMINDRQVEQIEENIESQDSDKTVIIDINPSYSDQQLKVDDKTLLNTEHTSKDEKIITINENDEVNTNSEHMNVSNPADKEMHVDFPNEVATRDLEINDLTLLPEVTIQTKQDECKNNSSTDITVTNISSDNQLCLYSNNTVDNISEANMFNDNPNEVNQNTCTILKRQLSENLNTFEIDIGEFNNNFRSLNVTHDSNSSFNFNNRDPIVSNNKDNDPSRIDAVIPYRKQEEMKIEETLKNNELSIIPTSSKYLNGNTTNEQYRPEQSRNNYTNSSYNNTSNPGKEISTINSYNTPYIQENIQKSTRLSLGDTKDVHVTQNNNKQYINNYSYAATKVAVSNKQVSDCHVQVIKKVKLAWNITEIITPCGSKHRENSEFTKNSDKNRDTNIIDSERNSTEKEYQIQPSEIIEGTSNDDRRLQHYSPNSDAIEQQNNTKVNTSSINYEQIKSKPVSHFQVEDKEQEAPSEKTKESSNSEIVPNVAENPNIQTKPSSHLFKCDTAVQNVLQKYLNIAGEKKTLQSQSSESRSTLNKIHNKNQIRESTACRQSRKPFKISDINKFEAQLPQKLFAQDSPKNNVDVILPETERKIVKQTYRDGIQDHNNEYKTHARNMNRVEVHQQHFNNIENEYNTNNIHMEQITPNTSPEHNADLNFIQFVPPSCIEDDEHVKLDISMFDPKTLLQCVNDDSSEMIPPPPQFCDFNVYSPEHYDETENNCNEFMREKTNDDLETSLNTSIFGEEFHTMLTPSKEIETWTLGKEDGMENSEAFTVMRHNNTLDKPASYDPLRKVFNRNRLEKFKFSHKSKWTARK